MPLPQENKKYTYADYLTWPEGERWEIIDGSPYMMTAPSWQHQAILVELSKQFANYFTNKICNVFVSPFDLRLPEFNEKDEDTSTVLQPDILIVCDKSKLQKTGYYGTPALIIEITSPSSNKIDKLYKFNKYEKAGVKEYWIVEPDDKIVTIFSIQDNGRYGRPDIYSEDDNIEVKTFTDLKIDLKQVFSLI